MARKALDVRIRIERQEKKILKLKQELHIGVRPFTEMLIINCRNVTPATGVENIDKE